MISQDKWGYLPITMSELRRPNIRDYMATDEQESNFDKFHEDMDIYLHQIKIEKFEKCLLDDYGITDETWQNTPKLVQVLMAKLHDEAEKHHYQMEELEAWRDNMPI